jgi:hypothetical protein
VQCLPTVLQLDVATRTRTFAKITRELLTLLLAAAQVMIAPAFMRSAASATVPASNSAQTASGASISTRVPHAPAPRCQTTGTREITITCDYTPVPLNSAQAVGEPRIALNHAALSFKTKHDNWASLTFTKLDSAPISELRVVYLTVDGDSGHNFIRRVLPSVDFRSLAPGQRTEFAERLLIPALQPGHYRIGLWIPSSDPSLKFNAKCNFLISSFGVADAKTGLNRIAAFSVVR